MPGKTVTLLKSLARTADVDSADQENPDCRGLHLVLDVTAIDATPSIVATIQGKDPISGEYYDLLASAAIATVSTNVLKLYPGITAAANAAVSDILPREWRVSVAHSDADSITYSVAAQLLP